MLPLQLRRVGLWSSRSDMLQFCVFLMVVGCAFGRPEAAGIIGYGPRCVHEPETIVVKVCHFEPVEACTSEPKVSAITSHLLKSARRLMSTSALMDFTTAKDLLTLK